jgi:outer membrane protein assembly factor BamA
MTMFSCVVEFTHDIRQEPLIYAIELCFEILYYLIMKLIRAGILIMLFSSLLCVSYADGGKKSEDFFILVPVPSYMPETGWGGMLTGAYLYHSEGPDKATPASILQFNSEYTQLQQSDLFLESDYYWKNNAYYLKFTLEYSKYPDKFFGIGPAAVNASPEDYTLEYEQVWLEFYKKIYMDLHLGARWIFQNSNMLKTTPGGLLSDGSITGSHGGMDSGLGLLAKWDTRDNVYFSMSGDYHQLAVEFFGPAIGGDYSFIRYEADLRHFFQLADAHCIALQGYLYSESGRPPFYLLDTMGGKLLMRGYYDGSFRDRSAAAIQTEYKWIILPLIVIVVNASMGCVSDEVTHFSTGNIRFSGGAGFRFFLDQADRITFRADWGIGSGTSGIYLVAGEAF